MKAQACGSSTLCYTETPDCLCVQTLDLSSSRWRDSQVHSVVTAVLV